MKCGASVGFTLSLHLSGALKWRAEKEVDGWMGWMDVIRVLFLSYVSLSLNSKNTIKIKIKMF